MAEEKMAPYLNALVAELQVLDHSRRGIRRQLCNVDSFGRWLFEQRLSVASITDQVVDRYVELMHRSVRAGYQKGNPPHHCCPGDDFSIPRSQLMARQLSHI